MKRRSLSLSFLFVLLITIVACQPSGQQDIQQKVESIQNYFAPDSRVAMFDVEVTSGNNGLMLKGETNMPAAKAALMDSISNVNVSVTDSISVLPDAELEGKTYGIVNNSVANLRSRPSHPAQLVTQATLGMPLRVLKKRGSWYMVQTPDDYLAWVDYGGLESMTKQEYDEWTGASKVIYLDTYGFSYERPSRSADKVSDLVSGSILNVTGTEGGYYRVSYPDGRTGYVAQSEARSFDGWKASVKASQNELVEAAQSMKGAPYLWGGTSSKGMDCSGFTKTIYFMNGWIIPRDASQQIHAGKKIDTSDGFDKLEPGDLLFFGKPATEDRDRRVVHVGMWIGDDQFIHSAGRVKVSSVNPEDENYDKYNLNRYLESRRYLNNWEGNVIKTESMYSFDGDENVSEPTS